MIAIKILNVMTKIGPIIKDKTNEEKGFDYASIASIIIRAREAMIEEKVIMIPLKLNQVVQKGNDENVYTVHTLRHTCATLLYRSGVNIKTIQELLGHVHIDTTEIYTHLDNQEVKDVMFEHPLAQFKMEDALAYCA